MVKYFVHTFLLGFLLFGSLSVRAQDGVLVKASLDRNELLIGEPIRLSIDVKSPMVSGNELPQFDSLPHFELMEKGNRDSVISASGVSYHLEWKLTSFDSGTHIIPSFAVIIGKQLYKTDSLAVEVSYGIVDTAKDYHDIKGIIDLENPDVKYIPWVIGALALIALVLFIWFIQKKSATIPIQNVTGPPARKTAYEDAMASLDKLKGMIREDPAAVKKYYSSLNDTLRIYLNRQLGLITMEKTSEELIHSVSTLGLDKDIFSRLTAALRMGDFVKFAKYVPGPFEIDSNLDDIRKGIGVINELNA